MMCERFAKRVKKTGLLCLAVLCLVTGVSEVSAQTSLSLREAGTNREEVQLLVGQPITVEVSAVLCGEHVSGIAVFVTIPRDDFVVVDQRPVDASADTGPSTPNVGNQPFATGPLLEGALELRNLLKSPGEIGIPDDLQLIEYQVVFGPDGDRTRSGYGVVATFQLLPIRPVESSLISILSDPIHETRLTLGQGSEHHFHSAPEGMQISVLAQSSTALGQESWASIKASLP